MRLSMYVCNSYHIKPPMNFFLYFTNSVPKVPGHPVKEYTTTYYTVTSTSLCPVTETVTEGGKTYTKTFTSTTTIYTKVPTVIYQTVHKPDETTKVYEGVTVTSTSLCPVTETKTVGVSFPSKRGGSTQMLTSDHRAVL